MTELCALNPELMDPINNVLSKAAQPPRPAPEKVNVGSSTAAYSHYTRFHLLSK